MHKLQLETSFMMGCGGQAAVETVFQPFEMRNLEIFLRRLLETLKQFGVLFCGDAADIVDMKSGNLCSCLWRQNGYLKPKHDVFLTSTKWSLCLNIICGITETYFANIISIIGWHLMVWYTIVSAMNSR